MTHTAKILTSPLALPANLGEDSANPIMRLMPVDPSKPVSKATLKLRLLKSLRCTLRYEKKAWQSGAQIVAGVDEVGRGSLSAGTL